MANQEMTNQILKLRDLLGQALEAVDNLQEAAQFGNSGSLVPRPREAEKWRRLAVRCREALK